MNVADPRLIWNVLLRNEYSPRSVEITPVSANASASRCTRTGSSVYISMFASRERSHVFRLTVTSTSMRMFASSGDSAGNSSRSFMMLVSITANTVGSPAFTRLLWLDSGM